MTINPGDEVNGDLRSGFYAPALYLLEDWCDAKSRLSSMIPVWHIPGQLGMLVGEVYMTTTVETRMSEMITK